MATANDFNTKEIPQWCPGCGNFNILAAIKAALAKAGAETHNSVIVTGIGCSGKTSHYIRSYGFESLHGRTLPVASAVKLANRKLTVVAMGGDGDGYGIGLNHLIHTCRRNINFTYVVHDNEIYGLTTGQASPTSMKGMKTKSTPHGLIEQPIRPLALAISSDATFVARTYSGNMPHMVSVFVEAITHRGFSLVDVLQPCPSWNKINDGEWFKPRIYDLNKAGHDVTDRLKAYEKAMEDVNTNYERIPIGIFYKVQRPTYDDELPQLRDSELFLHDISKVDMSKTLKEFE